MKKNLITLAVAAALASPLAIQAADSASVSGFANIDYTSYGDGGTGSNAFGADAEVDVQATKGSVTVRADLDFNLLDSGTTGASLEQAFFAWGAVEGVTVIGGVFNNPIGQEAVDFPDIEFNSHSIVYNILDHQTALNGNNIAGVAVAGGTEMFTGTLAVLNDIGGATDNKGSTENSIAAVLNVNPMEGLALELGYVTQDDTIDPVAGIYRAGNVLDVNAQYGIAGLTVGLDYLMADEIVDNAYNVWGSYAINDKFAVKARYEAVSFDITGSDTITKYSLYGSYAIADNLSTALEYSQGDRGNTVGNTTIDVVTQVIDDSTINLKFIGTF
ncbi:MAG TPA: porin [Gammaproteobacteria bacterium]|nr:porin [Gammaproteobacteria bacterium]